MKKTVESGNFGYPYIVGLPSQTRKGTVYLDHPTVALISKPNVNLAGMLDWVDGFRSGFDADLDDNIKGWCDDIQRLDACNESEQLIKAAGQLCYMSFLGKYTPNSNVLGYLGHILESKHFSVTEHANFSFFFGGVSRSWSHEAVRHRHASPSQLSQRYVDGKALRFVLRPEYVGNQEAIERFEDQCDWFRKQYEDEANRLLGDPSIVKPGMSKTDQRKAVNQVAREVLPNSTETAMVLTGNASAWRHFINVRASAGADKPICRTAWFVAKFLKDPAVAPNLFADIEMTDDWRDGVVVKNAK